MSVKEAQNLKIPILGDFRPVLCITTMHVPVGRPSLKYLRQIYTSIAKTLHKNVLYCECTTGTYHQNFDLRNFPYFNTFFG